MFAKIRKLALCGSLGLCLGAAAATTTWAQDRPADQNAVAAAPARADGDGNWGWWGLLGLVGLFGLAGRTDVNRRSYPTGTTTAARAT
jgi:MYXO-CTERM domain-containing protein